jgi:hypothetical protein
MATTRGKKQFQGLFDEILTGRFVIDMSTDIADGAGTTFTVAMPGAAVGDFVWAAWVKDYLDVSVTAYVDSANSVQIRVQNESGAALTTPTTTEVWRVIVAKPSLAYFQA